MDKNKDGFLCIDEWNEGIDKFLQLSDEAKQGFFNFMDKTNIGSRSVRVPGTNENELGEGRSEKGIR